MPIVREVDLSTIELARGGHPRIEAGGCVMEWAAFIAGDRHTAAPSCVSPVIAAFLRTWNDDMNDEDRQILTPYVVKVLDTNTGAADDATRAWLATDWVCRVQTPAWLRLAGLTSEAEAIEGLARIVDDATACAAQPALDRASAAATAGAAARAAARDAAWAAARDAAWAAAWDAAWAAAWDAAGAAARDAARDAAGAAAWEAAWEAAAAGDAARDAARDAGWAGGWIAAGTSMRETVVTLQRSALGLLDAMIAVGKPGVAR